MPFVSGLDLGQTSDPSALAVCEQTEGCDPRLPRRRCWHYAVRHLERYPLGTPYTTLRKVDGSEDIGIGEQVKALVARPPLPGSALAVDQTGVGRAVVDLLRALEPMCLIRAITITGGEQVGVDGLDFRVPKRELVGTLQTLLQSGRLKVARSLKLASVLEAELAAFRVKQSKSGHEEFSAWRERDHDDLVLAVALACWLGERFPPWAASDIGMPARRGSQSGFGRPPQGVFGKVLGFED